MQHYENHILDYSIQNALTKSMRKQAEIQGAIDFMSLWVGQAVALCKSYSVAELMTKLVDKS